LYNYCNNDPVDHIDPTGNAALAASLYGTMVALKGSFIAIKTSMFSFSALWWNIFVIAAIVVGIVLLVILLFAAAEKTRVYVESRLNAKFSDPKLGPGHVVYVLTDKLEPKIENVFYVGRTIHYSARMTMHRSVKKQAGNFVIFEGLHKIEARLAEQALISMFTLEMLSGLAGGNKIRGIAKKNIKQVFNQLKNTTRIYLNIPENEFLCLLEDRMVGG
jgi:hypothetical protein